MFQHYNLGSRSLVNWKFKLWLRIEACEPNSFPVLPAFLKVLLL